MSLFRSTLLALLLTFGITSSSCAEQSNKQITICTTIAPIQFLIEQFLAKAKKDLPVTVFSIIPPDSNPHFYEPKLSTRKSLQNTDIWVRCGEPIEKQIQASLEQAIIIDLRDYISSLSSSCCSHSHHVDHNHHVDTHFWLSINNLKKICNALYPQLGQHLQIPEKTTQNLLNKEIDQIDAIAKKLKRDLPKKTILTNHPILTYLSHDLGLNTATTEPASGSLTLQQSEQISEITKKEQITSFLIIHPYSQTLAKKFASKHKLELKEFSPYNQSPVEALSSLHQLLKP